MNHLGNMEKYELTFLLVGFVILIVVIEGVREKIKEINKK